jgi:hypothetical protein
MLDINDATHRSEQPHLKFQGFCPRHAAAAIVVAVITATASAAHFTVRVLLVGALNLPRLNSLHCLIPPPWIFGSIQACPLLICRCAASSRFVGRINRGAFPRILTLLTLRRLHPHVICHFARQVEECFSTRVRRAEGSRSQRRPMVEAGWQEGCLV